MKTMKRTPSFDVSDRDFRLIAEIAKRAVIMAADWGGGRTPTARP